jgi:UDP-N-acetylmuramoyl-tripeptide--D-alanyl-D-alanine ligase
MANQPPFFTQEDFSQAFTVQPVLTAFAQKAQALALTGSDIVTSTQNLQPGQIFLAIDGNNSAQPYLKEAVQKKAFAVVGKDSVHLTAVSGQSDTFVLIEKAPLTTLRNLAHSWRKKFTLPILAIAGSSGKTTTKELTAALLRLQFTEIVKTQRSENGFLGIALTLLRITNTSQIALIEIGIDEPEAMERHAHVVNPTAGLISLISEEHLEKLHNLTTVAKEELRLFDYLYAQKGIICANLADPFIREWVARHPEHTFYHNYCYKTPHVAQPMAGVIGHVAQQKLFVSDLPFPVPLTLLGEHNAANSLAAIVLASTVGIKIPNSADVWKYFEPAQHRSQVRTVTHGGILLEDYYNAQPSSMKAAFGLARDLSQKQRPPFGIVLALTDMLELGEQSAALHAALAHELAELPHLRAVILAGQQMVHLFHALENLQLPIKLTYVPAPLAPEHPSRYNVQEFAIAITEHLTPETVLVLKGSRGMKTERCLVYLPAPWNSTASSA